MKKYYLVEIDNETHKYNLVRITDKFGLSLELINYITTRFLDEESFKKKLFESGSIKNMSSSLKLVSYDGDKIISQKVKYYSDISTKKMAEKSIRLTDQNRAFEQKVEPVNDYKLYQGLSNALDDVNNNIKEYSKEFDGIVPAHGVKGYFD